MHLRHSNDLDGIRHDKNARRVNTGEEDGRVGQIPPKQRALDQVHELAPFAGDVVETFESFDHLVDADGLEALPVQVVVVVVEMSENASRVDRRRRGRGGESP